MASVYSVILVSRVSRVSKDPPDRTSVRDPEDKTFVKVSGLLALPRRDDVFVPWRLLL